DAPDIDAPDVDAGIDAAPDAMVDAPTDAMPTPSESIGFVRAASGAVSLPVTDVTVTYIKPVGGTPANDPAGFTVQAEQNGPAVMIAVDPATLTPVPEVGDVVSFTVTNVTVEAMQPRATAITGFTRSSQGADVGALAQDVSAATDLVTALDSYDSEIIDVSGTIGSDFTSAGSGFESAQITTTGINAVSANFVLRIPTAVRDAADMANGCSFTLDNTPVHRFNAIAQLTAYVSGDFTVMDCPGPVVTNVVALSATSVRVTFSRFIDENSVNADGSQFTFDNGLTASAATVSGRTVTLTTSAQSGTTMYMLTVASSVTDLAGTAMGTPNMFMFMGFVTPAVLRINEINANIGSGCDLIELRVISGGVMTGYKVQERTGTASNNEMSFTFTALSVATNDIIVLHTNSGSATCNPLVSGNGAMNETTVAGQPAAMFTRNYDTALDWYSSDAGLVATDNVITLYDATGAIMDCALIDDDTAPTAQTPSNVAAGSETQAAACAAANQWQNVGGGTPAGGYVDDDFRFNAVLDSNNSGDTNTGTTLQRLDDTDENDKADWTTGAGSAHTWGLINAGQSAL
ncbi:MAG: Ig-like domain-containing protein, partial [Deltaproteobacteria bacterium]|nr:Ig-like domain-containing protein [Kofleriaceae bacterium]